MSIVLRMWIAGKDKLSSFRVCLEECDEVIDVSSSSIPAKKRERGARAGCPLGKKARKLRQHAEAIFTNVLFKRFLLIRWGEFNCGEAFDFDERMLCAGEKWEGREGEEGERSREGREGRGTNERPHHMMTQHTRFPPPLPSFSPFAVASIFAITTVRTSRSFSPSRCHVGASFLQCPHHGA